MHQWLGAAVTQWCLHAANEHAKMQRMENAAVPTERLVIISATQLDDLLELSRLAVDALEIDNPLRLHLAGSVASVRLSATVEP